MSKTKTTQDLMGLPLRSVEGGRRSRPDEAIPPVLAEILPTLTFGTKRDEPKNNWPSAVRGMTINETRSVAERISACNDMDAEAKKFYRRHTESIRRAILREFAKDASLRLREYKIYRSRHDYENGDIAVVVTLVRKH